MRAFGGMISAELDGTSGRCARASSNAAALFALAESLGGVESLIEHPAHHDACARCPPEVRAELGISDGLVRLSVGIEDADDLIAELEAALA